MNRLKWQVVERLCDLCGGDDGPETEARGDIEDRGGTDGGEGSAGETEQQEQAESGE